MSWVSHLRVRNRPCLLVGGRGPRACGETASGRRSDTWVQHSQAGAEAPRHAAAGAFPAQQLRSRSASTRAFHRSPLPHCTALRSPLPRCTALPSPLPRPAALPCTHHSHCPAALPCTAFPRCAEADLDAPKTFQDKVDEREKLRLIRLFFYGVCGYRERGREGRGGARDWAGVAGRQGAQCPVEAVGHRTAAPRCSVGRRTARRLHLRACSAPAGLAGQLDAAQAASSEVRRLGAASSAHPHPGPLPRSDRHYCCRVPAALCAHGGWQRTRCCGEPWNRQAAWLAAPCTAYRAIPLCCNERATLLPLLRRWWIAPSWSCKTWCCGPSWQCCCVSPPF